MRNHRALWLLGICASVALPVASGHPQVSEAQSLPQPSPTATPLPTQPGARSADAVATEMLKLAGVTSSDVVYDLGSGNGQLAVAAVKAFGAKRSVGIESDPGLVQQSNTAAQQAGIRDRVQFLQQDLFKTDLREASVVTYRLPEASPKLRPKILSELKPGTRVVSQSSTLGDWKPDKTLAVSGVSPQRTLYYWVVPANIAGDWKGNLSYASGRSKAYTLQFSQQFQQVKGNVLVDGEKAAIPQITLVGNQLTFSRSETIQGQKFTVVFNGQIEGDTLKGVAELRGGILSRKYPIVAKRSSAKQALK